MISARKRSQAQCWPSQCEMNQALSTVNIYLITGVIEARSELKSDTSFGLQELGFLKLFSKITSIALKNSRDISKPLSFVNKLRSCFDSCINISKCTSTTSLNLALKAELNKLTGCQNNRLFIFRGDKLFSERTEIPYHGENNSLLQFALKSKMIQIFEESRNHRNFNRSHPFITFLVHIDIDSPFPIIAVPIIDPQNSENIIGGFEIDHPFYKHSSLFINSRLKCKSEQDC